MTKNFVIAPQRVVLFVSFGKLVFFFNISNTVGTPKVDSFSEYSLNASSVHLEIGWGTGKLNRAEAIRLLKDIMSEFDSFYRAESVSIEHDKEKYDFILRIKSVPDEIEKAHLNILAEKHEVEMKIINNLTVFRSAKKPAKSN